MTYDPIGLERKARAIAREVRQLDAATFPSLNALALADLAHTAEHLVEQLERIERYYEGPRR